jgi:hypothetical protein
MVRKDNSYCLQVRNISGDGKTPTDKSNAIKTVINFLSFVKPLKTGTNYPPT